MKKIWLQKLKTLLKNALEEFREQLKQEPYLEVLLHEYGHFIFSFIRKERGIEIIDIDDTLIETEKNPSLKKAVTKLWGIVSENRYGIDNKAIVGYSKKFMLLYTEYLTPEDFYNLVTKKYFIFLEEIIFW